jgi:ankyrin repeat protein
MNDNGDDRHPDEQLSYAIENDNIATASSLISSGCVNLNGESFPLIEAAQHGRVEIMTLLLDAGADVNAVEELYGDRFTACHVAIWDNHFDALKLLVERGAALDVVDCHSNGHSLLSIVAEHDRDERFAILLLDAGAPLDGLSKHNLMALVKSVAVFNRLLARGVNFTAMQDDNGATLCHFFVHNITCEGDVRFLVDFCGNDAVHAEDNWGKTPLHCASSCSNDSAVRVLVELGADIDKQVRSGWSALICAARWGFRTSCVELLVALGADVHLVTNGGQAACHVAVLNRHRLSLCTLVAAGGDLDQPDNKGETPRMIAIRLNVALPPADAIEAARRRIAKRRLDLVRERAFQICLGLQPLNINALQLCEILMHSFGALGSLIAFHQWWAIATKVKHFRDCNERDKDTMKK